MHFLKESVCVVIVLCGISGCRSKSPESHRVFHHPYPIKVEYDKFKDVTGTTLSHIAVIGVDGGMDTANHRLDSDNLSLAMISWCQHKEVCHPETVLVDFSSVDTPESGWKYINSPKTIECLADGSPVALPDVAWDGNVQSRYMIEHVTSLHVPSELVKKMAAAKVLECRVAHQAQFTFSDPQLEAIRDFASRW